MSDSYVNVCVLHSDCCDDYIVEHVRCVITASMHMYTCIVLIIIWSDLQVYFVLPATDLSKHRFS